MYLRVVTPYKFVSSKNEKHVKFILLSRATHIFSDFSGEDLVLVGLIAKDYVIKCKTIKWVHTFRG